MNHKGSGHHFPGSGRRWPELLYQIACDALVLVLFYSVRQIFHIEVVFSQFICNEVMVISFNYW